MSTTGSKQPPEAIFSGQGEVQGLARSVDWSLTPLGPVEGWQSGLRAAVRLCMASLTPTAIWAGPEFTLIYNQGYVPVLGPKHPKAMGLRAREVWGEHWHAFGDELSEVMASGVPTRHEDAPFLLQRNGREEEAFFTYTFTPIREDDGRVVGVFNSCEELTRIVRAQEESEERYRSLFNSIDEGFCILEVLFEGEEPVDYRLLENNPAFVKHTGIEGGIGRRFRELMLAPEAEGLRAYGRVAVTGEAVRFELPVRNRSRYYDVYAFRVGAPEQRRVAVLFNDITERKRAEEALKQEERKYRSLFENSVDAVFVVRHDGTIVDANTAACRMHGMTVEEIRQAGRKGVVVEDERFLAALDRRETTGRARAEFSHRRKDGTTFPVEVESVVVDPTRSDSTAFVIARDITEQKSAEEELKRSEGRFRTFFNTPAVGTAELGVDGVISEVNERMCQLTGYRREELLRMRPSELTHPDDRSGEDLRLVAYLRGEFRTYEAEKRYVRKDGEVIWVQVTAGLVLDAAGRPARSVAIIQDITERRRTEDALATQRRFLSDIMDGTPSLIVAFDEDQRITFANEAAARFLGTTKEALFGKLPDQEFLGMSLASPVPAELARSFGATHSEVMATGQPHAVEVVLALKNGERTILSTRYPLRDGHGRVYGTAIIATDITAQKRAASALRESEQRFRLALRNAPVSVATQDRDLRYLWAYNQRSASEDEIVGKSDEDLFTPTEAARIRAIKQRVLDEGVEFREQLWLDRPGGRMFLDVCWEPIRDEEGRVTGVASATVDLTPIKLAQEALREGEARLREANERFTAAVRSSPVMVFTQDKDLRYTWIANPAFGYRPEEVVGKTDDEVFETREDAERLMALKRRVLASGESARDVLPVHDGELVRWLDVNVQPQRVGGAVVGILATAADITERKEAEEVLRKADKQKSEFLAVLSHELRNPLAPIRNSILLLDRVPPGSESARRAREVLIRQVDQLARLVNDLLDLTRISHGKIELQLSRLDARGVVGRACEDAKAGFEQRGVRLNFLDSPEPLWMVADEARLAQMVDNLLSNALKFTPPGGRVEVRARGRDSACEIAVKDSGAGIEPGDLERIFDPFVQADRTKEQRHGGLGIGLALVRDLVSKHGGTVRASSGGPGQGSEFVLRLPLAEAAIQPAGPKGPVVRPRPLSILLVEDNEDAATSLAELLSLAGHEVQVARLGREGVRLAAARAPQALICDIGLPDMTGYEVIRAIRAEVPAPLFAVALTGYAQPTDRDEALSAGFDMHLPKPPPLDELEAALEKAARLAVR